MKNLLVVFPHLIYPLDSGGAQAIFNGIEAVRHDYRVSIVYFEGRKDHHPKERQELARLLENVEILPYYYTPNRLHKFKALESIVESKVLGGMQEWKDMCWADYHLPMAGYMEFVNQVIQEKSIDLVQLEMMESLPLVLSIPDNVKKVFVHHELRFIRNELKLKAMNTHNSFNQATVEMKRILEIGMLNRYDGVITLSDIDRLKLQEAGVRVPVYSSFAIVKQHRIGGQVIENSSHVLSFVGPEYHTPNSQGLLWFLDYCWPVLKSKQRDYRLRIVGKWSESTRKVWQNCYDGIEFMGFVDDLAATLSGTTMIVPILEGSGIRMKILEAASMGVPVVTTSIGVEGLPLGNGVACMIGDNPDEFVNGIISLEKEECRQRLTAEAYKVVKEQYSMKALSQNRREIYQQMGI
ncbi:MAG: glycosyltransferase family 4 protein [Prevotella sp.]|nr:glycosyltransferase family 4 protein [Prevotella sp.]